MGIHEMLMAVEVCIIYIYSVMMFGEVGKAGVAGRTKYDSIWGLAFGFILISGRILD